jgi:hypothetical protein
LALNDICRGLLLLSLAQMSPNEGVTVGLVRRLGLLNRRVQRCGSIQSQ